MSVHPKLAPILYGMGVFVVFYTFAQILKLVTHQFPAVISIETLFPQKDLLIGLGVAVILTYSHERKKKLK